MTLSEAIEEVQQSAPENWDWRVSDADDLTSSEWQAIATILNAVVKGELK